MEKWKPVIVDKENKNKYSDLYAISNEGRVKNLKTNKILKPLLRKDGYLRAHLYCNGKVKDYAIHRLVLLAFKYNEYFNKAEVNHKDENKLNNHLENLEWCTAKYNSSYGTRIERCTKHLYDDNGNFKGIGEKKAKKVIDNDTNKIYNSLKECAIEKGINYKTLQGYVNGKRKRNKFNIEYY